MERNKTGMMLVVLLGLSSIITGSQRRLPQSCMDRISSSFKVISSPKMKKAAAGISLVAGIFLFSRAYNHWDSLRKQAQEEYCRDFLRNNPELLQCVIDLIRTNRIDIIDDY